MADPTLELHNANGALIASNNNWQTTIIGGIITSNQVQDIQNSGYAPGTRGNLRLSQTWHQVVTPQLSVGKTTRWESLSWKPMISAPGSFNSKQYRYS